MAVLDALVRHHDGAEPIEVSVFETDAIVGPGRAYALDTAAALLNQPVRAMSVRFDDGDHFLRWLAAHPDPAVRAHADREGFPPRAILGGYLRWVLAQAISAGPARNVHVRVHREQAVALGRAGDRWLLTTRRVAAKRAVATAAGGPRGDARDHTRPGGSYELDAVFLCVGTSEPEEVYGLAGSPGFIADPYLLDVKLAAIDPDAAVAVLGTGLTAVDVVLTLAERGHRGPIRMVSRHGYLPSVRTPGVDPQPRVVTREAVRAAAGDRALTIADVAALAARELDAHGIGVAGPLHETHTDEHAHVRLARQIAEAERGERWPALLMNAASNGMEEVWASFSTLTRRAFQRDWHARFMSFIAPIPLQSAQRLAALIETGQLEVLAGIADVRPQGQGFSVEGSAWTWRADHVVNTIRSEGATIPLRARALVESLLAGELAFANPFGGLRIDLDTNELLMPSGAVVPRLYALGQLATGDLYVTTSNLRMITRRAERSVCCLLGVPALAAG